MALLLWHGCVAAASLGLAVRLAVWDSTRTIYIKNLISVIKLGVAQGRSMTIHQGPHLCHQEPHLGHRVGCSQELLSGLTTILHQLKPTNMQYGPKRSSRTVGLLE